MSELLIRVYAMGGRLYLHEIVDGMLRPGLLCDAGDLEGVEICYGVIRMDLTKGQMKRFLKDPVEVIATLVGNMTAKDIAKEMKDTIKGGQ